MRAGNLNVIAFSHGKANNVSAKKVNAVAFIGISRYSSLLLTGKLDEHLAEIDRTCTERVEMITNQLTRLEGVMESLKAAD